MARHSSLRPIEPYRLLIPVFADETPAALTAEEAGAVLQGYGAIKGDSNGDLMIDKELKRQDAVVILTRLMGKEAEVEAMDKETKSSFDDITIDYYQPFLAFAEAQKWVEGKGDKKFGFNDVVTVKEFTAMLLRALGHDTMGENYAKVMDIAKEQGIFNGVTAEEAANVVRGTAFVMMNNTLETAPKGEDKALVYKLGYKQEPKPENLTVLSAEAAGLKAIDVKFSKEVDENTLKSISVKNSKKVGVDYKAMLLDGMTARLVFDTKAVQDAKYDLVVDAVKTAAGEVVEKFEGSVFMTDAARIEVLSVEALNPKTLLVKVSEPADYAFAALRKMPEFKIEGKALNGKALNSYGNEFTVELSSALKAGDYKIEVSGIKDFAGFVAKTQEFDVTVVEDKEAPMVVEAKMIDLNNIKVVFNEGIYTKGTFKVNGANATPVDFKNGDKEIKLNFAKALDIGAVVEVKVEYKGQKDIMGNMVKDLTAFTFKVEDDTNVPEVKEISVKGKVVSIKFSKVMLTSGAGYEPKYTILKAGKEFAKGNVTGDWKEDNTLLKLTVNKLEGKNADEYVIVLEGFKDATIRMNPMPKTELALSGKDTLAPQATAYYAHSKDTAGILTAKIFFTEEMDEETLLDAKNYTFDNYKGVAGNVRADAADVSFTVEDGGKIVVIEGNDKKVTELGNIALVGLKDKAGNMLDTSNLTNVPGKVEPKSGAVQKVKEAKLYRNSEGKLELKLEVEYGIPTIDTTGVLKLESAGAGNPLVSNLTLTEQVSDRVFIFAVDTEKDIKTDGKTDLGTAGSAINLVVVDGTKAKSILNEDLGLGGFGPAVSDGIAPRVSVKAEYVLTVDAAIKEINEDLFDEDIVAGTFVGTVSKTDGTEMQNLTVAAKKISWANSLTNGEYVAKFSQAKDAAGNDAEVKDIFFKVTDDNRVKFVKFLPEPIQTTTNSTTLTLEFSKEIAVGAWDGAYYDLKIVKKAGGPDGTIADTAAQANALDNKKLDITIPNLNGLSLAVGDKIVVEIKDGAGVTDKFIPTDKIVGTFTVEVK